MNGFFNTTGHDADLEQLAYGYITENGCKIVRGGLIIYDRERINNDEKLHTSIVYMIEEWDYDAMTNEEYAKNVLGG